jgi:hypothetical protein
VNRAVVSDRPLIVSTDEAPMPAALAEAPVSFARRDKRADLYLHND